VLTANHHGVDYFAQSIQGSLIFALNRIAGATPATTVPVFACGGVPLDNLTYPLGLLLYRVNYAELGAMPKKLPVFSNRFRREMVSAAAPFNPMMVQSAKKRFDKMVSEKIICPTLSQAVHEIFKENYCAPSVVDLPDYSQQSVVLNNTIWKRFFPQHPSASDIVYHVSAFPCFFAYFSNKYSDIEKGGFSSFTAWGRIGVINSSNMVPSLSSGMYA
jgi:hypothetical protein